MANMNDRLEITEIDINIFKIIGDFILAKKTKKKDKKKETPKSDKPKK